jgi:hypothetical protein
MGACIRPPHALSTMPFEAEPFHRRGWSGRHGPVVSDNNTRGGDLVSSSTTQLALSAGELERNPWGTT